MIWVFLGAIELFEDKLEGASVGDSVVVKAIACSYSFTQGYIRYTLRFWVKKAKAVFEENGIAYELKKRVDTIIDVSSNGVYPFEKVASETSNPKEDYIAFKVLPQS